MTTRPSRARPALALAVMACAGAVFSGSVRGNALSALWDNGDGNWSDPTQWSTQPLFPNDGNGGNTYNTAINYGNVTLDGNVTIDAMTFGGGAITGANSLTINQLLTWSGGTLGAATNANGGIDFNGGGRVYLSGGTLTNGAGKNATIGATGNIWLELQNGATFVNAGSLIATNGGIANHGGATSTIANSGTFTVNVPASAFTIGSGLGFTNTGAVNVQAGILTLQSGDNGTTTGAFNVSGGAALNFAGGSYTLAAPSSVSGAGSVNFSGATLNVSGSYSITGSTTFSGGAVSFSANAAAGTVNLSSGTVGGAGTLNISGLFTWSGGTLGVAATNANGGIDFNGGSGVFLSGGTLTNAPGQNATIGASGNFHLNLQNGATFINAGTFTASSGNLANNGGATSSFNNTGTFDVNVPASSFTVGNGLLFNNSGAVNVQAGTLVLQAGDNGSTAGSFNVSPTATLSLAMGKYALAAPSSVSGLGSVAFSGATVNIGGSYGVTGTTTFSGGTVSFTAGIAATSTVNFVSGTVQGTGTLNTSALFTWSGGTLGLAATNANGGIDFHGSGNVFLSAGTLTNASGEAATIGATGNIWLELLNGAAFTNAGTLTATSGGIIGGGGATSTINNSGTFNVNSPGSLFTLGSGLILNDTGSVNGNVTMNGGTLGGSGVITGNVVAGSGPHRIYPSVTLSAASATTLTVGGLATSANTTLSFNLVTPGSSSVNDALLVTGKNGLTLNGGTLQIANTSTGAASLGYYKTVQYTGAIGGTGIKTIILPPVVNSISYILDLRHDPGFIDVHRGLLGDANDDGMVNFADFVLLSNNFGASGAGWGGADFNNDGVTNFADFVILSNNFGATIGANDVAPAAGAASGVPEPTSLVLLGAGLLGVFSHRRTPRSAGRQAR